MYLLLRSYLPYRTVFTARYHTFRTISNRTRRIVSHRLNYRPVSNYNRRPVSHRSNVPHRTYRIETHLPYRNVLAALSPYHITPHRIEPWEHRSSRTISQPYRFSTYRTVSHRAVPTLAFRTVTEHGTKITVETVIFQQKLLYPYPYTYISQPLLYLWYYCLLVLWSLISDTVNLSPSTNNIDFFFFFFFFWGGGALFVLRVNVRPLSFLLPCPSSVIS